MLHLTRGMLRALSVIRNQEWKWHSNHELTTTLRANPRTIRRHTRDLAARGFIDQQRLGEGFVFRAAAVRPEDAEHLKLAAEAYGIDIAQNA